MALTPYLKQHEQYLSVAQKLVDYLQSQQKAPATWSNLANNKGLFIDALVAKSLYPYQDSNHIDSFKSAFVGKAFALQNQDGSWQQDSYVTALVLNTLNNLQRVVSNPITSGIDLSVVDANTGVALPNVVLYATKTSVGSLQHKSDTQGNIHIADVKPGLYQFALKHDGYALVNFTLRLRQGEQLNLGQIQLVRTTNANIGQIQGVVTDITTKSVIADATVTVVLVDEKGKRLPNIAPIVVNTDNNGRYQVTLNQSQQQASQGRFGIHVEKSGYLAVLASGIAPIGGSAVFNPTLQNKPPVSHAPNPNTKPTTQTGSFQIRATNNRSKSAIMGFLVKAELLNNTNQVIQTQSFAPNKDNLSELLATLEPGKWRLTVSHKSYQTTNQTFVLKPSQTIHYTPNLVLKPYEIKAVVVDSLTNKPIAKTSVKVVDSQTKKVLFVKATDEKGRIHIEHLTTSEIEIETTPTLYLATKRYFNKTYEAGTTVDMGEIRLRPKSAEVLLPDLAIAKINLGQTQTDTQDLQLTGRLTVIVENKGVAPFKQKDIKISVFIDSNHNRRLDKDEKIIGNALLNKVLDPYSQTALPIPVATKLRFRDAPIAVMVDSDNQVVEQNKNNNVKLTSDGIEIKPNQGTLDAKIAWQNQIPSDSGAIAAPLTDTNGDGVIGMGDIASVFVYQSGRYYVLDGKTGKELFQIEGMGSQQLVAIGDVNGDKQPDIVAVSHDGLRIYDNVGNLNKTLSAHLSASGWSSNAYHPILADLNQDGITEIVQNDKIFNYKQGLIKDNLPSGHSQAVADVDGDGMQDIIGLQGVSDSQGNLRYYFKNKDRQNIVLKFVAIGDVNGIKKPQIIAIYDDNILIFDAKTGVLLADYTTVASAGGSPVIADFDGDGVADIGIARSYSYVAMRGDGSVIWDTPINDSSGGTGSTVFDFDNDGKSEAVHFDEQYLRIYDAATGKERIKIANNTATAHEYPIVGDFDGDGHADIIMTASSQGVRMVSSKNNDWANTRNIWNQYSYHVTNINDDLTIPIKEPNSWQVHNTYRANLLLNQNATSAVDLTASYIQVTDNGLHSPSYFKARIGNAGTKTAPKGTPIGFYQKDSTGHAKLLGIVRLSKDLGFDEYADINLAYSPLAMTLKAVGEIVVIANDAGAGIDSSTGIPNPTLDPKPDNQGVIQEYSRHNNLASLTITNEFAGFRLSAHLDKTHYTANETVKITSIPTNLGSFRVSPSVKVSIFDSMGNLVGIYPPTTVNLDVALINQPLLAKNSTTLQNTWHTAQNRVGNYTAKIELSHQNRVVASVIKPFSIVADGVIGQTKTTLTTDKTQYRSNDLVQIHSRLLNTASNAMATPRKVVLNVIAPTGKVIWTKQYYYPELAPNALKDQYFTLPLYQATAGDYVLTSTTTAPDGLQSRKVLSQPFKVLPDSQISKLSGAIKSQNQVEIGDPVYFNWQLKNPNNALINNIALKIVLFRADNTTPFDTIFLHDKVSTQNHITGNKIWRSTGSHGEVVSAMLVATFDGEEKALAQTQVKLVKPSITAVFANKNHQKDTLLVYYSCENGWHTSLSNSGGAKFNYPCFDARADIIRSYLDRLKVDYKLVKHPWEFRHELQSGIYGQYWLLGAIEKLSPHTYKELLARVYTGENLLFDAGMHSWLNHELFKLAGVTYQGRLAINSSQIIPNIQYLPLTTDKNIDTAVLNTQMRVKAKPLHSNWALSLMPNSSATQVWAVFDNRFNAISAAPYGNGYPIAVSFDLIRSLDLARTSKLPIYQNNANASQLRWHGILSQLLKDRKVKSRAEYTPSEPVKIPITLNNHSNNKKQVTVEVILPNTAQWLSQKDDIFGFINKTKRYQITLYPKQSLNELLTIRLPEQAGLHTVKVKITDSNKVINQLESRYLVKDIDSRIKVLKQHIGSWRVVGTNGALALSAKIQIGLIQTHLNTKVYELAVYEAANLTAMLSKMQDTPTHNLIKLHNEANELLRALQIKWYLARQGKTPLP
ncbi:FG-GAP repeat-containing protein [Moraxella macacae 0408225]|uniref:FG-GAP repeat-containing protein n=1 Tax=Moraxella macacae 0408225 TaxID=1230338 RepID=L2F823_9GAMM|nr:FG-GAP repeat-containing protein [Moraxella macacae 0408225]